MVRIFDETQPGEPAPMHLGPGGAVIMMPVPKEKTGQLLAGMAQAAYRRQPGPCQVAHRLVGTARDPY